MRQIGRRIGAVLAGYLAMVVLVIAGTTAAVVALVPGGLAAAQQPMPDGPPAAYLAANLLTSLLAAIAGGWVTARLAPDARGRHVLALSVLLGLLGFASAAAPAAGANGQPVWYPWVIPLIGIGGVLLGGHRRLHRSPD